MSLTDVARPEHLHLSAVEREHDKDYAELAARIGARRTPPLTRSSTQCWNSKLHSRRGHWLPAARASAASQEPG